MTTSGLRWKAAGPASIHSDGHRGQRAQHRGCQLDCLKELPRNAQGNAAGMARIGLPLHKGFSSYCLKLSDIEQSRRK